ncbi:atypical/ABC1/ABC1-C protein kinase, partial [Pseudoloma neurophilia]
MFENFLKTPSYEKPHFKAFFMKESPVSLAAQLSRAMRLSIHSILPVMSSILPKSIHKKIVYGYFTQNGYVLMKIGQWLASRPDIVPFYICEALSKLHADAPRHTFPETIKILQNDQFNLKNLQFESLEPVGSGSIAQVYKLRAKKSKQNDFLSQLRFNFGISNSEDKKQYALKVIHPMIKEEVFTDMQILTTACNMLSKLPFFNCFDLQNQIKNFKREILKQINFNHEIINMRLFRHLNKYDSEILIPKPVKATENVLLIEYMPGKNLQEIVSIQNKSNSSEKNKILAQKMCSHFLKSVFHDRFLHTDLHPGNLSFINNQKVIIYDFGLAKYLTQNEYDNFLDLIIASFLRKSPKEISSLLVKRLADNKNVKLAEFIEQSSGPIEKIVNIVKDGAESPEILRNEINQFISVCNKNKVKFDHKYNNVFMSGICLDGILKKLDPECTFYRSIWRQILVHSSVFKIISIYCREVFKNL